MGTKSMHVANVAGAIGLAGAALALTAVPAGAAVTIKVKPDTGIVSGSQVKVSGTGLKADKQVAIFECWAGEPGSVGGCDAASVVEAMVSSTGVLAKTKLTVSSSYTSADGTAVTCGNTNTTTCGVVIGYVKKMTEAGQVAISFAP